MFSDASSSKALVVYGHVGFDVSTMAGKVTRMVGGSAYYAAMAAAAQGAEVSLVSILGADFPEAALKLGQLDISASQRGAGLSAVFTQTYNNRNEVIAFDGKLNVCADLNPETIPLGTLGSGAILLTTAPPAQQARALEWLQAREFHGLIAIDTALAYVTEFGALLQRNEFRIGVLFVNAAEFEALAQCPPPNILTIVKRGSQGASLLENGVWLHVSAPVAEQVRTVTGPGDVFAGAFLATYLKGRSSAEALARAVAYATSYVEAGAELFYQNYTGHSA